MNESHNQADILGPRFRLPCLRLLLLTADRRRHFMCTGIECLQVDRCRKFGANVIITGAHIGEAKHFALTSPEYKGESMLLRVCNPRASFWMASQQTLERDTVREAAAQLRWCPRVCHVLGVKYINGYDDPEIVAGAGTIGTKEPWPLDSQGFPDMPSSPH